MAALRKLCFVLVLLSVFRAGWSQPCTTSDMKVTQRKTAEWAHGNLVYQVEVANSCICSQSSLFLRCPGFSSTTLSVDPALFRPMSPEEAGGARDLCLVNAFQPIFYGSPINFQYAPASPLELAVYSSVVNCS